VRSKLQVGPGGDRRSIIGSFRYGREYRSVVAPTRQECWGRATLLWGPPDALELFSTPDTIYNDLAGITAGRAAAHGMYQTTDQESW
jgi:hypothetical protein